MKRDTKWEIALWFTLAVVLALVLAVECRAIPLLVWPDEAGGGVGTHVLLDSTVHTDTTTGTVQRGDLITGQTTPAEWTRLAIGAPSTFLRSDGVDASWSSIDISTDTNLAVTAPVTLTGDTVGLNQNAGTDVTADLEEEAEIRGTTVADDATNAQLLIGTGAGTAAWSTMSGDATIDNTGAISLDDASNLFTPGNGIDITTNTISVDAANDDIDVEAGGIDWACGTCDAAATDSCIACGAFNDVYMEQWLEQEFDASLASLGYIQYSMNDTVAATTHNPDFYVKLDRCVAATGSTGEVCKLGFWMIENPSGTTTNVEEWMSFESNLLGGVGNTNFINTRWPIAMSTLTASCPYVNADVNQRLVCDQFEANYSINATITPGGCYFGDDTSLVGNGSGGLFCEGVTADPNELRIAWPDPSGDACAGAPPAGGPGAGPDCFIDVPPADGTFMVLETGGNLDVSEPERGTVPVYNKANNNFDPIDFTYCDNIVVADDSDDHNFWMAAIASTITRVGCHCETNCVTPAIFALEDRSGNAMTHTAPTCSTGTGATTFQNVTASAATGTLTFSGNVSNGNTVTIGNRTYNFRTTLTEVKGYVKIGASATASRDNLLNAINLTGTPGTDYAAVTWLNPDVTASTSGGNMLVTAKTTGATSNAIATTETAANLSWGASTLTGGSDQNRVLTAGEGLRWDNTQTMTTANGVYLLCITYRMKNT